MKLICINYIEEEDRLGKAYTEDITSIIPNPNNNHDLTESYEKIIQAINCYLNSCLSLPTDFDVDGIHVKTEDTKYIKVVDFDELNDDNIDCFIGILAQLFVYQFLFDDKKIDNIYDKNVYVEFMAHTAQLPHIYTKNHSKVCVGFILFDDDNNPINLLSEEEVKKLCENDDYEVRESLAAVPVYLIDREEDNSKQE